MSLAELMFIHTVMVEDYGATAFGVRDQRLVESALHRPLATFEGRWFFADAFARTAALWVGLIKNHGFVVDANKRTATAAAIRWLDREGYWLRVTTAELVAMAVGVANDQCDIAAVASWLEERSVARGDAPTP